MKSLVLGLVSSALGGAGGALVLYDQGVTWWITVIVGLAIFVPGSGLSIKSVGDSDDE